MALTLGDEAPNFTRVGDAGSGLSEIGVGARGNYGATFAEHEALAQAEAHGTALPRVRDAFARREKVSILG